MVKGTGKTRVRRCCAIGDMMILNWVDQEVVATLKKLTHQNMLSSLQCLQQFACLGRT